MGDINIDDLWQVNGINTSADVYDRHGNNIKEGLIRSTEKCRDRESWLFTIR